jgi:hypothetical protein
MPTTQRHTSEYDVMINSVASYLEKKGYERIRADLNDFEKPSRLRKKGTNDVYMPDLTARKNNGKCYFEIVNTTEENKTRTIGKWQLLSTLAQSQNGKFFVLVPYGKMSYTNRLLANHNIDAEVVKMQSIL